MSEKEEILQSTIEITQPELPQLDSLMPSLNVNIPAQDEEQKQDVSNLVSDDTLMGLYGEIVQNIRDDRTEVNDLLSNFVNMVVNEGDSSNSSKEALVNLVKIKSDMADKMAKIADLMTRIK